MLPKKLHKLAFIAARSERRALALRVSTEPCRCHSERSAKHGVEILPGQNREAESRQGSLGDDRGGGFSKKILKIDFRDKIHLRY